MNDLHRPNHGNQQIANVFDAVHKREDQNRKELRQPGRMIVLLVFLRELGFFIFFMIKRPHAIAKQINLAVNKSNQELRQMANAEKRYAEEHFSIKNQLDAIEAVYQTL